MKGCPVTVLLTWEVLTVGYLSKRGVVIPLPPHLSALHLCYKSIPLCCHLPDIIQSMLYVTHQVSDIHAYITMWRAKCKQSILKKTYAHATIQGDLFVCHECTSRHTHLLTSGDLLRMNWMNDMSDWESGTLGHCDIIFTQSIYLFT